MAHHAASPSSSSASSSSRAPPFSLVEFGNLVSAALDPILSSDSPLFSVQYGSGSSKTAQDGAESSSSSRVRTMLTKFKRRASTLIKSRPQSNSNATRPAHASSPEYRIPELRLSSAYVSCDDEFVPYLPLVAQYERESRRSPLAYVRPSRSTPSLPLAALKSQYNSSSSSHSDFPSPTMSTSSCSSTSTSSSDSSQYPTTPLSLSTVSERWSECSIDEDDPFGKPVVQVHVTRSIPSRPRPPRATRAGGLPLTPAKPPPVRPIPALPPSPSSPSFHNKYATYTHAHPYARATPLASHSHPHSRASLLDAFPAPPTHTPSPSPKRPVHVFVPRIETPPPRLRPKRASSPFPFADTPTRRDGGVDWDWLDLEASPCSGSLSSPRSVASSASEYSELESDADGDVFHSACSGPV